MIWRIFLFHKPTLHLAPIEIVQLFGTIGWNSLFFSHQVFNMNAPVPPSTDGQVDSLKQPSQFPGGYGPGFSSQPESSVDQPDITQDPLQSGEARAFSGFLKYITLAVRCISRETHRKERLKLKVFVRTYLMLLRYLLPKMKRLLKLNCMTEVPEHHMNFEVLFSPLQLLVGFSPKIKSWLQQEDMKTPLQALDSQDSPSTTARLCPEGGPGVPVEWWMDTGAPQMGLEVWALTVYRDSIVLWQVIHQIGKLTHTHRGLFSAVLRGIWWLSPSFLKCSEQWLWPNPIQHFPRLFQ